MKIRIKFEPRDLWIGVYWTFLWTRTFSRTYNVLKIYICIIPMFPILLAINTTNKPNDPEPES